MSLYLEHVASAEAPVPAGAGASQIAPTAPAFFGKGDMRAFVKQLPLKGEWSKSDMQNCLVGLLADNVVTLNALEKNRHMRCVVPGRVHDPVHTSPPPRPLPAPLPPAAPLPPPCIEIVLLRGRLAVR